MAYKFTGVVNLKWIEATRLVGMQYKPSEKKLGWPMAMEPCRIACLQYPQHGGNFEDTKKQEQGQTYISTALRAACESGDIPYIAYDRVNYYMKSNGELDGIDQWKEFAIEAKDFAEWLDARFEKPSEYIDAWFQANKMEVVQPTAPATTPSPPIPKRQRDLLSPLIKAAQRECQDQTPPTIFAMLRTWATTKPPRPPLLGVTEDGIQWIDANDKGQELTMRKLRDRLRQRHKGA